MRKLLVFLLSVVSLATAGAAANLARSATAASKTVTISAAGYKPTAVSIAVGDSVVFKNSDKVAHTVDFKQTTGLHCSSALPLAIAAGSSASCSFASVGKFNFSDPANKGNKFHGTVTVAKSLTAGPLTLTPKSVVYGRKTTLAGTLATLQAGQSVQVLATECGTTTSKLVTTVTTTTGGKFSYAASPLKKTAYAAKVKNTTSSAATANVMPRLVLGKVAKHRYTVSVSAAQSFAGKRATFQRWRKATKRWIKVKRVTLKANTTGVAPTVISSAKFRSKIKSRLKVRIVLGPKQVGACYAAGRSNTIRS
jgi:plastocyanin